MGDEEDFGVEWVEGFAQDGKDLDRIVKPEDLERMQRQVKEHEVQLSKKYREKRNLVEENQEKLQEVNKSYLEAKSEHDRLTQKEKVELDSEQKGRIERVTRETIDNFLVRRQADENQEVEVDVHFESQKEDERDPTSDKLNLGGEGAGSRDAKFIVSLESKVEDLAQQAAKYWGLDAMKVFFLDRDERIVPDDMTMKEIVLPPGKKRSPSMPSSSTAMEMWTVKGRNYSFKLVRAETVLKKEDLTSSNGVQWNDFTFQENKLEEELENTRKKYGDTGMAEGNVNMDEIPSLFDLINKGAERKRRKRADTRCRILEFSIFILATVLFYWLLSPDDSFVFYMQLATSSIKDDLVNFTQAETLSMNAATFYDIKTPTQYNAWLQGPLSQTIFGSDTLLRRRNVYVLAAFGVSYAPKAAKHDVQFCTGDSLYGSSTCFAQDLANCMNDRAVQIYNDSRSDGHITPECQRLYDFSAFEAFVGGYRPGSQFTYMSGAASTYFGGTNVTFNLTELAAFDTSIQSFLNMSSAAPARLVNVFLFVPSLNGLAVIQMLAENVMSGSIITSVKQTSMNIGGPVAYVYPIYALSCILAFVVFLMEIRRILGRPKRWSFEDHRDPCTVWTCLFFLLPIVILVAFVLVGIRESETADTLLQPSMVTSNGCELPSGTLDTLYDMGVMDIYITRMKLAILVIFNLLFFRYLLMYFPQLSFLAEMVLKVIKPLLVTISFIIGAVLSMGVVFFAAYGTKFEGFKNVQLTAVQTLRLTMGGIESWYELFQEAPALFLIVEGMAFVLVTIILTHMALAIMVSHKKEKDLHENSSFHPFWVYERSKAAAKDSGRAFNPAIVGEDFRKKKKP